MSMLHELIAAQLVGGGGGGGSGMELFLVTFTYSSSGFSSDKTLAQITAAKTAGKYVEGVYSGQYCPLVSLSATAAVFQMLVQGTDEVQFDQISVLSNGCMGSRTDIGFATVRETVSGTSANIDPETYHYYLCGALTALTVDSSPGTGGWSVRFTSGSTATVLTMPNTVVMPDGFDVDASTVYEINVLDNYALVASWPVGV